MTTLEKLLDQQKKLREAIQFLTEQDNELQKGINREVLMLPMIYGRCIKELKCTHSSNCDNYHPPESTVIHVGDVIKFFRYPLEGVKSIVTLNINSGEWIEIPYSTEYFEFFPEDMLGPNESVRDFNRD